MQVNARHMIIELIPKECTSCGKLVHSFFQSQEEFDTFKCQECKEDIKLKIEKQ